MTHSRRPGDGTFRVAIAQIAPVYLDRDATLEKVEAAIAQASDRGAELVAFGETLVPGYPFWPARSDGARFEAADQKRLYSAYVSASPSIAAGDLGSVSRVARDRGVAVVLGVAERSPDRGGSVFASRVFLGADGAILSVHRKLVPTHEERLVWAQGDGAGLRVHPVGPFQVGALNCWENWMPTARAALYAQGETLHVMLWPGSSGLTREITRFVARESRSFVVSAGSILRAADVPADVPERARLLPDPEELLYDGGSCAAGPDGEWILEPVSGEEGVFTIDLDPRRVLEERQSFDPAGHYCRPEILRVEVDRTRPTPARFRDRSDSPDP